MKGDAFYVSVKDNQRALIHPSSTALNGIGEWCIFDEVVLTSATYLRTVTFIKGEWYVVTSLSLSLSLSLSSCGSISATCSLLCLQETHADHNSVARFSPTFKSKA